MMFYVEFKRGEDGFIIALCPSLKGCVSQGKTLEEARKNIIEAIKLWIETANEINTNANSEYELIEV